MAKIEDKGLNGKEWVAFLEKYFLRITDMEDANALLFAALTHAEREELPKRLNIINELLLGKLTQREIAKKLNVSIANVSRGANTIKLLQTKYDLKAFLGKLNGK